MGFYFKKGMIKMKNKIEVYRADQILGLLVNPEPEQEIPSEATYRLMVVDKGEVK